jgi:hypothetical protein
MGLCSGCANKSDEELLTILHDALRSRGLGPSPEGAESIKLELGPGLTCESSLTGIEIVIEAENQEDVGCHIARYLASLLDARKLLNFVAFWRGKGHCHAIVGQLHQDFKDLGIAEQFEYMIGSSDLLRNDSDPEGLHSWIEMDGWAIDASGGGAYNPITIRRVEPFYKSLRLENIRERTEIAC